VSAVLFVIALALPAVGNRALRVQPRPSRKPMSIPMTDTDPIPKLVLSEEEWKKRLTPEQYQVLRKKGTERAFCARSGTITSSASIVVSAATSTCSPRTTSSIRGLGWPSFFTPVATNRLVFKEDQSHLMQRTEVLCAGCDSHLGHVFDDGPPPLACATASTRFP